MKRKFILPLAIVVLLFSCNKHDHVPPDKKYSADMANAWMQLQIKLTRSTTGYNSVVSDRSFGYAGLTLYESVSPGIRGSLSLLSQIGGTPVSPTKRTEDYYWPASLNAAMASITKQFFESTSAANMVTIDSLENAYKAKFKNEANAYRISNAEAYGLQVANSIFEWSKTDGGHEAYKHIVDPSFMPKVGEGLWIPTFPAYGPPVHPHWGDNRSFIANSASLTQPGPPTPYSELVKSPFYEMVNELYTISLSLTHEDSTTAKFWGDQPGNLNVPAHATNILTQLIVLNKMDLYSAAAAYALHGIAMNDASISTFKSKYTYNLLRPISYIRNVMLKSNWNSVIPTPPHPEYTAAHAVVSAASAAVLENIFGKNYHFTDHSYDGSYGTRSFNSFQDYANEAGHSRLLAGIHYGPSIAAGLKQGKKIGEMVNKLKIIN
ncbi:MAG: vanadium-dependent haloperoxidase [Ginsengibacter sp.]